MSYDEKRPGRGKNLYLVTKGEAPKCDECGGLGYRTHVAGVGAVHIEPCNPCMGKGIRLSSMREQHET